MVEPPTPGAIPPGVFLYGGDTDPRSWGRATAPHGDHATPPELSLGGVRTDRGTRAGRLKWLQPSRLDVGEFVLEPPQFLLLLLRAIKAGIGDVGLLVGIP